MFSIMKLSKHRGQLGFTLIELLIVMTILGILFTIAVPSYQRSVTKARETALRENLYQMRQAIDAYFADNARYPDSLQALIDARYLRSIPQDPFTQSSETWETVPPEPLESGELAEGGVFDVYSGSDLVGLSGIPYEQW